MEVCLRWFFCFKCRWFLGWTFRRSFFSCVWPAVPPELCWDVQDSAVAVALSNSDDVAQEKNTTTSLAQVLGPPWPGGEKVVRFPKIDGWKDELCVFWGQSPIFWRLYVIVLGRVCLLNLIFSWWFWHPFCIYPWNVDSHLNTIYVPNVCCWTLFPKPG